MPSITWQVKPPQYVWQPAGALAGSSGETPALGEFWYREGGAPGTMRGATQDISPVAAPIDGEGVRDPGRTERELAPRPDSTTY